MNEKMAQFVSKKIVELAEMHHQGLNLPMIRRPGIVIGVAIAGSATSCMLAKPVKRTNRT